LKYTQQDAQDFFHAYLKQEGRLYHKIDAKLFTDSVETQTQYLKERIQDIANLFELEVIRPIDQIIIFISTHGKSNLSKERPAYWLHSSDLKHPYYKQYSLDFERDIIDILRPAKCKKLLFIDACNSGTLIDLIKEEQTNLQALVSCDRSQLSYEDSSWQNGAFTEVLLEAFNNETVSIDDRQIYPDANQDRILTLAEVYQFLINRVPYIVKKTKQQTQMPFLVGRQQKEENVIIQLTPQQ